MDTGAARSASGSDAGVAVRVMEACWGSDAAAVLLAPVDEGALRLSLLAAGPDSHEACCAPHGTPKEREVRFKESGTLVFFRTRRCAN